MMKPIDKNTLFYGDNLDILREYIPDESIDLIYLDPPFNSSRSYNVLFKDESGQDAESQITAFEDTWHWGKDAESTYHELVQNASANVSNMISALRDFLGANQMTAYLVMMTARLIELRRVLKSTGSIYLHCDPTASHYLKIVMDAIFGIENFRNEITWIRTSAHANVVSKYGAIHDIIFYYTKSENFKWNQQYIPYDEEYIETFFDQVDSDGRCYARRDLTASMQRASSGQIYSWHGITPPPSRCWAMTKENMDKLFEEGRIHFPKKEGGMPRLKMFPEDMPGVPIQDVWTDIKPIHNLGVERLGYPTQKPVALLERIIQASSNEGDVILDPFCGCGTAIAAAEKLKRSWMGIDVTHLSITLMKYRLKDSFNLVEKKDYAVVGEPEDLSSAMQLAKDDRYQFQWWALSLVQAKPLGGESGAREGKKGSDKGIDGVINFINEKGKTERVVIQVKSGHVKSGDVRDLRGVLDREESALGVFITLEAPSKDMVTEAVSSGYYHSNLWDKDYPRIQILTIEDLLNGKAIDMPKSVPGQTFKQAGKIKKKDATQSDLF